MRPTGNWSPALTDRVTDFFLGPPALRPAAPFFAFAPAPVAEASMSGRWCSPGRGRVGIWLVVGDSTEVRSSLLWKRGGEAEYLKGRWWARRSACLGIRRLDREGNERLRCPLRKDMDILLRDKDMDCWD